MIIGRTLCVHVWVHTRISVWCTCACLCDAPANMGVVSYAFCDSFKFGAWFIFQIKCISRLLQQLSDKWIHFAASSYVCQFTFKVNRPKKWLFRVQCFGHHQTCYRTIKCKFSGSLQLAATCVSWQFVSTISIFLWMSVKSMVLMLLLQLVLRVILLSILVIVYFHASCNWWVYVLYRIITNFALWALFSRLL